MDEPSDARKSPVGRKHASNFFSGDCVIASVKPQAQDRMEPFDTIDRIRLKERYTIEDVRDLRMLAESYPSEPELWDFLGDVMQICDAEFPIGESIACYKKALECDSTFASAYESLGWALDSYFDDFASARINFELAIAHGGGDSARIGLARVLAQMGKAVEANQRLHECEDKSHKDWLEMSREIREGFWCSRGERMA